MNPDNLQEHEDPIDQAVSARLAKLRTMPVDTARLEAAIARQIPRPKRARLLLLRPIRAVAASFLLLATIVAAIVLSTSSGPVDASAAQMAQVHQDIISGRTPVMLVDSIEAANRMLAERSPGAPSLPQVPAEHVMACCMKSVHNKKMACVLLKDQNQKVTLAVANASDMNLPAAPAQMHNGVSYRVQSVNGLSMVMTQRNGRWLCLMGQVSPERLMDLAAEVRF